MSARGRLVARAAGLACGLAAVLTVAGLSGCCSPPPTVAQAEEDVLAAIDKEGVDSAYVALKDDVLLIRVDDPLPASETVAGMMSAAVTGHKSFPQTPRVVVQLYSHEEPLYAMAFSGDDLAAYIAGNLSDDELGERIELLDLRSPETAVERDLAAFPVLLRFVNVSEESVSASLLYEGGTEEGFWQDLTAMALVAVEDCPWVESAEITYLERDGEPAFTVSIPAGAILDLADGSIDAGEFADQVEMR